MRIAERNPIFKCELQCEIPFSDVPLEGLLKIGGKRSAELRVEEELFFEIVFADRIGIFVGFAGLPGRGAGFLC